jgi:hypothetical protein
VNLVARQELVERALQVKATMAAMAARCRALVGMVQAAAVVVPTLLA